MKIKKVDINTASVSALEDIIGMLSSSELEMEKWPFDEARRLRDISYGKKVFIRGLIEYSSYCVKNCFYCGIRKSNRSASRYRLTREQILQCCEDAHKLGFRSFVLQGGEDPYFTDAILSDIVLSIKDRHPDSSVTLSSGERSTASYRTLQTAGTDRYLLRHETADNIHYSRLHPKNQTYENRINCLKDLKKLCYQTGAGFMVGSPYQTDENLAKDLILIKFLSPQMVGIGPYIPHSETPFHDMPPGNANKTLIMLALTRILLPDVLLPATTAMESLLSGGRKLAFYAGANVVMPNISPASLRSSYSLYNNKVSTGSESKEGLELLNREILSCGLIPSLTRGDHASFS